MPVQKRLLLGAVALLCGLFLVRSLHRASQVPPVYNWDMVCYVALAIGYGEDDPATLHEKTYATLQEECPPAVYQELIRGGVKGKRHEDVEAFTQHLNFYRARVLYTFPIYLLNQAFGVPFTAATYGLSRAAWIGLALLMCVWASRALGWAWGLPTGALLAHAPWFIAHMGFSSPDLLATLLTCTGLYFLVELRKERIGAALLTATIAIRPDTVILALVLAAAIWCFDRERRPTLRFLVVWGAACLATYLSVSRYAGAYGWWPLFWISFIKKEEFPAAIDPSIDWTFYLRVVQAKWEQIPWEGYYTLPRGVTGSTVPLAFAGAVLGAVALIRRSANPAFARYTALFFALGVTYLVRWLLFPQLWDRFFAVLYACVPLVLLSLAATLATSRDPEPAPLSPEKDCNSQ